ncbi:MAG: hypothetical protein IPO21_01295 [Bacteroidales bacterium]|nr:hypothetical protein [Bacteroidales bacterium]
MYGNEISINCINSNTYTWSSEGEQCILSPSATNKYLLTVVNAHNCISKDSIIVTIKGNAPIITIEKDTVCQGNASEISIVSDIAIDSTVWIIENQIINTDTNKHVFSSLAIFQFG